MAPDRAEGLRYCPPVRLVLCCTRAGPCLSIVPHLWSSARPRGPTLAVYPMPAAPSLTCSISVRFAMLHLPSEYKPSDPHRLRWDTSFYTHRLSCLASFLPTLPTQYSVFHLQLCFWDNEICFPCCLPMLSCISFST